MYCYNSLSGVPVENQHNEEGIRLANGGSFLFYFEKIRWTTLVTKVEKYIKSIELIITIASVVKKWVIKVWNSD